jgi:transposase InsO family protein
LQQAEDTGMKLGVAIPTIDEAIGVWNRIPDDTRQRILQLALDEPALSPRELAVRCTDSQSYFVSEPSVYRLLKAHDPIASPAFMVIKAADAFKDKTTAPNQLWQTDFTYLKVIGWGWFYLSTVLDDFSRYIAAWKLCTSMRAEDVTAAVGDDDVEAIRRRDLTDHGPDGFRLVEGRNDEAQRLHRIPQFWQGAGGASDRRLVRKSR